MLTRIASMIGDRLDLHTSFSHKLEFAFRYIDIFIQPELMIHLTIFDISIVIYLNYKAELLDI